MYRRDLLPSYAGIHTFFRAPLEEFDRIQENDVAILGIPWDSTLSSRIGCRYGPEAIRKASLRMAFYVGTSKTGELINLDTGKVLRPSPKCRIVDLGDLNIYLTEHDKTAESIRSGLTEVVRRGGYPVTLGGDHYITYPVLQGVAQGLSERNGRKPRIGYIQFDAHFDLGDRSALMGRFHHGSMARRIAEMDEVSPNNMVWIGVRGYARKDQVDFCQSSGGTFMSASDVKRRGIRPVIQEAIEIASKDTDGIYVSVDIDSLDPSLVPGTGTIAFGGLTPEDLLEAMDMLKDAKTIGFDITEVAPNLDLTGVTEILASQAVFAFLSNRILEATDWEREPARP